jgi:hypothetical protein
VGDAWVKEVIILTIHPDRSLSILLGWINHETSKLGHSMHIPY